MFSTQLIRRSKAAASIAATLLATTLAASPSAGAAAIHAGSGSTSLKLDTRTVGALTDLGVSVAPIGSADIERGVASFRLPADGSTRRALPGSSTTPADSGSRPAPRSCA